MRSGSSVSQLHDALLPADLERRRQLPPAPAEALTVHHCPGVQKWWAHELSTSSLASSDGGYTQQPWLPDEVSARCMLCAKPFHFWRWTHHCRDCGGLYCDACSTHRVEAPDPHGSVHVLALRLCDTCAFSPSHPRHLGCASPCACPRCSAPSSAAQLLYYAKAALVDILCFPFCCVGWSYIGTALAAQADARMRREKQIYSLANQPADTRPHPARITLPPDARLVPPSGIGAGGAQRFAPPPRGAARVGPPKGYSPPAAAPAGGLDRVVK